MKFSSLEIKSLIKYLHLINNENIITKIKNHVVKNNYEDIIFASNLAQEITEDSKLFLGPASEEELTAVIYQLAIGKKFDNLSLTRIYNKFLFSIERDNPFTKVISKNKPKGYFTISDFKKSGDAEDRSKFNQQFYDYRDKYNQYDASILAGSIITSSNITVEEFTQAPKSIQTFAVFGKSLGEYRSTKNVTEKPPQYIPGRIVLMKLSSGRYLLSSNLLGNIKSIILEEQEGNFININLSNKGLVNSKKISEVDPRYQLYEGLYHVYPDNMVYYEIIKPLYGSDWSKNPISKISHDYFTVAQDSKAAKIEINASSTVANTLAQGMAVALAAYIEDLHQSMDETSKTWKIIRGFIPFYNTIYNASTDSEYIIDSGEILLDIVSIIPIFKTASTVGKSASEVINLGRSALKAGVANGLRGLQLFKYVAKQVAPELLSASYKNSLLITKAFYDAIEPVPIRSSLKGLYKGIKNDLNLTSLEGISSKVLMTSNEKANLKLSNNGIWKNDAGKSYIKDAKGEFYQVERNQSNQGWVLINGDRKTPISNSGGRWGVKKEEGEFKRLLNGDHRTFPQSWSVKNSDLNYITPEKGIYKLGSENSQKLSEPKYYIKQEGAFYQVRWDESNHTWRIINPANPGQFSYSLPVKLAKKNSWEFNSDIGLKGGTRTDLNNWMKEHIDEYSRLPKKNEEAIARYTGGRYRLYNEKLRAGKMTKNIRESIDEVVSSLRMLPEYSGTVYRGGAIKKDVYKEMKVGGVIFDPAFLSTSADSAAAMEFLRKANTGKDEMRYLMTLEVKRGRSLMDKSLSQFADTEAEVLLLPETPIEITKIENKGPDLYIYGKEVDPVGQDAKDIFNNKMKIMSEPSTGSLGAKVDNVPVVKKNTDIDIDVNNHADSNKDGLWEIHSDVGLKGGGLNDLRDIFRKNSASLESKLSAGDTSVFRTRGYLGTEKNTKIDTSFEYLRVDKVSNHKSGRIFSMDSIGEGGEMEGVISVSKGSNLSSKLSGNTIGKWGVKDKLDDSVDFIEVSNGASGAVGIKISLNQLQEGKPVIVSAGELSGCTMIYAVDDDYFYAYHAGQNPGDNSWLTSRDGVNSIYQTHMSLKGKPISDLSLDNNNDLIKIFSTYDKATINYFGKKKPISLSGKNTSLSVDTHISTPYSENVNVFDYNAAKGSDPRLGLAYAILTRKNGKVSVSTYSEDISIALKDKKLTSLARKEENLVTNKNIVTAGNSKEQVSNVMSRHAEKITYNLAPDIPASEYLDELYQKTGIAAKIQDPKGKCQVLMNPIADFMKEKGFFDIRYRGMYIWNNATEQIPMNHFVVVGKKGGKDYVFDVSAHQFENKGMSDLNEPLILSAEDWAKKYRGATTRKLIYYSDFKNARTAANTYHALPRALVPGSMEGKTFITSPNWYDTFKRTEYDKLFIKRARLLRDRNHNPLELEQVNRRLTALLNETSDVSHHVNY
ncbi:cytotoxic necrotizing factor Rho-activating domain-containing protein [Photorhabdus thracensis]|uniref:cytotoxic necrotizing factor Rho-activating domain-containing protein n=1 Tax=Photorhabdus thracensis TaxID=230089 RepID=UPI002B4BA3A8|nr:cytotoxic necrotizing factor Rho-activating domain-containing protein [Photorhabdus thracensis]MCC8420881.1 hypothetical protein [Photorhabdus thracensis]